MADIKRKLATVRKIAEIKAIEGADRIQAFRVDGWWCVDQVGRYKLDELVVYIEPDAWVKTELAPFLSKGKEPRVYEGIKGEKLRTIRLKKQVSQGLLLPISPTCDHIESELFEGLDVTVPLGIVKWEPVLPSCLVGQAKGLFPSFAPKTDQERIENEISDIFIKNKDSKFEVTLKLDGSSESVFFRDGELGVCSRNLQLKMNEENADNTFIATATKTGLLTALEKLGRNIMVQGELCGNSIQGNRENFKEPKLFVFDIFNIDKQEYLGHFERLEVFRQLQGLGFTGDHVPILFTDVTLEEIGITDVASSKIFVDRPSINHPIAEGAVFKRMDGQMSFKSINNKFLLSEKD